MSRKRKQKTLKTLVSIIIPVHRRFDLLEQCLDALPEAFSVPYEVIMVDNASPSDEAKPFYDKYNQHSVIRNAQNVGFPKACNQGVRRSKSPLIFFLNSDVIMRPGSGDKLVRQLDDPSVGVVGMKLLFPEHDNTQHGLQGPPGKIQHVGLNTTGAPMGNFVHSFIGWDADHSKVMKLREMYAVTGAALMTRRKLFLDAGLFWEGYGMGTFEDVDFCLKSREMGYNVIVDVESVGIHYTGATARQYGIGYALQQNQMLFMQRWNGKVMYTEWAVV